jgi:cell wall-associated NlpC family hydrolase
MSRVLRRLVAALAATGTALIVAGPGSTAAASPALAAPTLASAQQRASALRSQVDRLTAAAETASEDYNTAQVQLADLVTRHLLAEEQLQAQRSRTDATENLAGDRIRGLYMSGGPAGLANSVLDASNLGDAVSRMQALQSIVADDRAQVAASAATSGQAGQIADRLAALSTQQLVTERQAAAAADRVRGALATQRRLLAAADATVRQIAEQERQAAAAAAARAAAARLAAAQRAVLAAQALAASQTGATTSVTLGTGSAAPNTIAAAAIAAARTRLGAPYVWGATGPSTFDCSGLTSWAYRQAGAVLPRTSRAQWNVGRHVELGELQPGDLLFWANDLSNPATIHHVALYIGDSMMIAAPQAGDVVKVQPVYLSGYIGAVRPIG